MFPHNISTLLRSARLNSQVDHQNINSVAAEASTVSTNKTKQSQRTAPAVLTPLSFKSDDGSGAIPAKAMGAILSRYSESLQQVIADDMSTLTTYEKEVMTRVVQSTKQYAAEISKIYEETESISVDNMHNFHKDFKTIGNKLNDMNHLPEAKEMGQTMLLLSNYVEAKEAPALLRQKKNEIFKEKEHLLRPGAGESVNAGASGGVSLGVLNTLKVKVAKEIVSQHVKFPSTALDNASKLAKLVPDAKVSGSVSATHQHEIGTIPDGEIGRINVTTLGAGAKAKATLFGKLNLSIGVGLSKTQGVSPQDTYASLLHLAEHEAYGSNGNFRNSNKVTNEDPSTSDLGLRREKSINRRYGEYKGTVNNILQTTINEEPLLSSHLAKLGIEPDSEGLDILPPRRKNDYSYNNSVDVKSMSIDVSAGGALPGVGSLEGAVSASVSDAKYPFTIPDSFWDRMGLMDDEVGDVHKNERAMHVTRKEQFSELEKNVMPRISALLEEKFPSLKMDDRNAAPSIERASTEQLFSVLGSIEQDMEGYSSAVKLSSGDHGTEEAHRKKHQLEDAWGGKRKVLAKGRTGRHGFLQAMSIAHSAIGLRIKNQHSEMGDGAKLDPSKKQEWKNNKAKLDEVAKQINAPKFLFDPDKLSKDVSFAKRLTPHIVTQSANFQINLSKDFSSDMANASGSLSVKVSHSDSATPIVTRTGEIHQLEIAITGAILGKLATSVAEGNVGPDVQQVIDDLNGRLESVGQSGDIESVVSGISNTVDISGGLGASTRYKLIFETFKPATEFHGKISEPKYDLKYVQLVKTTSLSPNVGVSVPTPVAGLNVDVGVSANHSKSTVIFHQAGTNSIDYMLQIYARLHIAKDEEVEPNNRFNDFVEENKDSFQSMLAKAADPSSHPFEQIFLERIPRNMMIHMEAITQAVGDMDTLRDKLHMLLGLKQKIVHDQSADNHLGTMNLLIPNRPMLDNIDSFPSGIDSTFSSSDSDVGSNRPDYMVSIDQINEELTLLGFEIRESVLGEVANNDDLDDEEKAALVTSAESLLNTAWSNVEILQIAQEFASGENNSSQDLNAVMNAIGEIHIPRMDEYKESFKEDLGFEGKLMNGQASTVVNTAAGSHVSSFSEQQSSWMQEQLSSQTISMPPSESIPISSNSSGAASSTASVPSETSASDAGDGALAIDLTEGARISERDATLIRSQPDGMCLFQSFAMGAGSKDHASENEAIDLRSKVSAYVNANKDNFGDPHIGLMSEINEALTGPSRTAWQGDGADHSMAILAHIENRPLVILERSSDGNDYQIKQTMMPDKHGLPVIPNRDIEQQPAIFVLFNGTDHYDSVQLRNPLSITNQ